MKRKNVKKRLFVLIILLALFFLIYYSQGEMINSTKSEITKSSLDLMQVENERNSSIATLNLIQSQLAENNSELRQLKSGDIYYLHDPTMQEVTDFINDYGSASLQNLLNNAKSQGIRCAYVMAFLTSGNNYPLIGFDTIDKGMIYFEAGTRYQVIPKIGSAYTQCVVGSPYSIGVFDIISDIVCIW